MKNFVLNENLTNGFYLLPLSILLITSIICSILVIISKNPIISVLFLIALFANISGYLILIGIIFIGLSYMLVYIGAISILFIFILMLINVRISELYIHINDNLPLGLLISILFYYPYMFIFNSISYYSLDKTLNDLINWINIKMFKNNLNDNFNSYNINEFNSNKLLDPIIDNNIEFSTSNLWEDNLIENTQISSLGNILYTSHNIWLIISSIILLLSMIGAIIITIKPFNHTKPVV